jgi:hypothetical protein
MTNTTLTTYQANLTASLKGSYNLSTLFVNTTTGESQTQNETLVFFAGTNQAPNVTLVSPANGSTQTNSAAVTFAYTPTDDLDQALTCNLYTNSTGSWLLNQTRTVTNSTTDTPSLTLVNGDYKWNVQCNDSEGNTSFAPANYTVTVNVASGGNSGGSGGSGGSSPAPTTASNSTNATSTLAVAAAAAGPSMKDTLSANLFAFLLVGIIAFGLILTMVILIHVRANS